MTSQHNPFQPPRAALHDAGSDAGESQPMRIWPPSGRMGRLRWLAYGTGTYIVTMLLTMLLTVVAIALHLPAKVTGLLPGVLVLISLVFYMGFAIQRSHDMDLAGWMSLLTLIPFVAFYWLLKPGSPGANRYGAPPPPNTLGVKLLGLVLPGILVIGILAAIALPAYHDYTQRARAAAAR